MATIDVLNLNGEKVGSLELADEVFGAINEDLLWEAVKHYRASLRAGTHATKTRGLASLDKLNAKGTTLLVSNYIGETEKNLHLSVRNLKGVELVAGNEVHPYHLLRYNSAVFARPALERLQDSLKASAPKRKAQKEVAQ